MPVEKMVYALFWLLMGVICSVIAGQKGRSPFAWLVIGSLTSIIGLIIIAFLPSVANRRSGVAESDVSPALESAKQYSPEDDKPVDAKLGEYLSMAIIIMGIVGAAVYAFSS